MKRILLAIAALALCSSASAIFLTGNDLHRRLTSDATVDQAIAKGFIIGVHDALEGKNHCSPANVTVGQISDIAAKYLRDIPSMRHTSAESYVAFALNQTWPCAKNSKGSNL